MTATKHPAAGRLIPPREQAAAIGVTTTEAVRQNAKKDPTFPPEILPGFRDVKALVAWKEGRKQPPPPDVSDLIDYHGQAEIAGTTWGGVAAYASNRTDYPPAVVGVYRRREDIEKWQAARPGKSGRPAKNSIGYAVVFALGDRPKRYGADDEGFAAAEAAIQANGGVGHLFERPEKGAKSVGVAWAQSKRRVHRKAETS